MARKYTIGWETNNIYEGAYTATMTSSQATISATSFDGAGALQLASTSAGELYFPTSAAAGTTLYARMHFRFSGSASGSDQEFFGFYPASAVVGVTLVLAADNSIYATGFGGTANYGYGLCPPLAADTWHVLEMSIMTNTGSVDSLEYKVNGTTIYSGTNLTLPYSGQDTILNRAVIRSPNGTNSRTILLDNLKINDGTGSVENSYPNSYKIAVLLPTADSAVGSGWTKPGGSTTNLWSSVDNEPPTGIADSTSAANAEKQIRNATSATATYTTTTQTYTAAGITGAIKSVQPVAVVASNISAGAKTGSLSMGVNPAVAAASFGSFFNGVQVASTYPAGWYVVSGTYTPNPTISSLSTAPTVSVTITGGTSTRGALVSHMSVVVEYDSVVPKDISVSISEAISAAFGISRTARVTPSIAESVAATLSATRTRAAVFNVTEATAYSNALWLRRGIGISMSEALTASLANVKRVRTVASSILEGDTVNMQALRRVRSVYEGISEFETVSSFTNNRTRGNFTSIIESLSYATTPVNRARSVALTVAEIEALTNTLRKDAKIAAAISESQTAATAIKRSRAAAFAVSETLAYVIAADVQHAYKQITCTIAQATSYAATVKRVLGVEANINETEVAQIAIARSRAMSAAIALNESVLTAISRTRKLQEAITEQESMQAQARRTLAVGGQVNEILTYTPAAGRKRTVASSVAESEVMSAALKRLRSATLATVNEVEAISAQISKYVSVSLTVAEAEAQATTASRIRRAVASIGESLSYVASKLDRVRPIAASIAEVEALTATIEGRFKSLALAIQEALTEGVTVQRERKVQAAPISEAEAASATAKRTRGVQGSVSEQEAAAGSIKRARKVSAGVLGNESVQAWANRYLDIATPIAESQAAQVAVQRDRKIASLVFQVEMAQAQLMRSRENTLSIQEAETAAAGSLKRMRGMVVNILETTRVEDLALQRARAVAASFLHSLEYSFVVSVDISGNFDVNVSYYKASITGDEVKYELITDTWHVTRRSAQEWIRMELADEQELDLTDALEQAIDLQEPPEQDIDLDDPQ